MTRHTVFIPQPPDPGLGTAREGETPFTAASFLKNLLALGSVFWAGYLWLVLAA